MVNNKHQFEANPDDYEEQVAALVKEIGTVCSSNPVGVVIDSLLIILADVGHASPLCRHTFTGTVIEELLRNMIRREMEESEEADPRTLN